MATYSMEQAVQTQRGMQPKNMMWSGARQGTKINPGDYKSLEEYKKAVLEEEAREKAFFDRIGQRNMMPPQTSRGY